MVFNKKRVAFKFLVLILCFVLIIPTHVLAAEETQITPYASYYLDSYQAYVYPAGNGKIQVWFDVTCVNYMDELGALSIWLYESTDNSTWTLVKTFLHEDNPSMLDYDDISYTGHVDYQGIAGRYYKAYVCVWAGKDGGGDSRYYWTSSKRAT